MEPVILTVLGVVAGTILGLLFFGGLWWTSQRMAASSRPGLLLSGSFLARLAMLAVALVLLARMDETLLIGALVGMLVSRTVWTRAARTNRLPDATRWIPDARGGS